MPGDLAPEISMLRSLRSLLILGILASRSSAQSTDAANSPDSSAAGSGYTAGPPFSALGEGFEDAIVVPGIPFNGSGNTCNYSGSTQSPCSKGGPDQVHVFTPSRDMNLSILASAGSKYAVIGVYENTVANYTCYMFPPNQVPGVPIFHFVRAGNTYYIVGEVSYPLGQPECGGYGVQLDEAPQRCSTCPAGAIPEDEPVCYDGWFDRFNAGCTGHAGRPIPFKNVTCGATPLTICGSYGDFREAPYLGLELDHDWYRIQVEHPTSIQATVSGDETTFLQVLRVPDPVDPCAGLQPVCPAATTYPCSELTCTGRLSPGTYLIRIEPSLYRRFGCGWNYTLTLLCSDDVTRGRRETWGNVKAIYR